MKIAIVGAGLIGLYVGARIAEAGGDVIFYGRQRMKEHIDNFGFRIHAFNGHEFTLKNPHYMTTPQCLADTDYVFLCVKTTQTDEVLKEILPHLKIEAKIISLQNGIQKSGILESLEGSQRLVEGMVMFNVILDQHGQFYQATSGPLFIANKLSASMVELLNKMQIEFKCVSNFQGYKWSKLLLNLNNALNAISGRPLKEELEDRGYRKILAQLMRETIGVSKKYGVKLEKLTDVPTNLIPYILDLPDFLFKRIAKKMIDIDPLAKSSMLVDLENHRPTEIKTLNYQVYELARAVGLNADLNRRISEMVLELESKSQGPSQISSRELWEKLRSASP